MIDLRNLKRDSESGAVVAAAPTAGRRNLWPAFAGGALLILAAAGAFYWLLNNSEQIHSLAVLPFENGSGDPDAEYFSDGVTESIISSLS